MNLKEHMLVCLAEECAEVSQVCGKALRFGMDDRNVLDPTGPTNAERMKAELNDLFAVVELLQMIGILEMDFLDRAAIDQKKQKVFRFIKYAQEKGALECP